MILWKIKQFLTIFLLPLEYAKDFCRFVRYGKGSPLAPYGRRLHYDLILFAHTVEKGLSLAEPRPLFGRKNIMHIREMLLVFPKDEDLFAVKMAVGALEDYLAFHRRKNIHDPFLQEVEGLVAETRKRFGLESTELTGGAKNASHVFEAIRERRFDYPEFIASRFSCRSYEDVAVSPDLIREIVKVAQRAPSQCNRQSAKVHCYQSKEEIRKLLDLQGGAKGFSDKVSNLFIVTSEITAWSASSARNQDYIDGSLFAMCLLLSLHAHGLAACPLNLAVRNNREKRIRRAAGIPDSERLIFMISFGYPKSTGVTAACSERVDVERVLYCH